MPPLSLKRTILALSGFAILTILTGGYLYLAKLVAQADLEAALSAERSTTVVVDRLEWILREKARENAFQARDARVLEPLASPSPKGYRDLDLHLADLREALDWDEVYLVDPSGTVLATSDWRRPDSSVNRSLRFRDYYQNALQTGLAADLLVGIHTRKPGLYLASAVRGRDGKILGILVGKMDLERAIGGHPQAAGDLVILDGGGNVFRSGHPEWSQRRLWAFTNEELGAHRLDHGADRGLRFGRSGSVAEAPDGQRFFFAEREVEGLPGWRVVFLAPHEDSFAKVINPFVSLGVLGVILATGTLGIIIFQLYRRASGQIRHLGQKADRLKRIAITDELTGIYNRRGFLALAGRIAPLAKRNGDRLALYYADLNGLKAINDTHGHKAGDRAIIDTAEVLSGTFRESDVVARLGGDEFAVLALCHDPATGAVDPDAVIRRINERARRHSAANERPYTLNMSVGCTVFDPDQFLALESMLERADSEMYAMKMVHKRNENTPEDLA